MRSDRPDFTYRRSSSPLPSPEGIAVGLLPYSLRACRLVILYNTQYRLRYAQYVKPRNIAKILVVTGTGITISASLVLNSMPERYARYSCTMSMCKMTMKLASALRRFIRAHAGKRMQGPASSKCLRICTLSIAPVTQNFLIR